MKNLAVKELDTTTSELIRRLDPLNLIAKRDLAKLLNINPWTVDRWRRKQRDFPQPLWVSPTTPRWRRVDVETWLASRQHGGRAPEWQKSKPRRKQRKRRARA
jgi:predicted DNA-binding transcriptional regulator AlpA